MRLWIELYDKAHNPFYLIIFVTVCYGFQEIQYDLRILMAIKPLQSY